MLQARRTAGLTQAELAVRLGRDQGTIARWETARQKPSLETLVEVLHACGRDLSVRQTTRDDSYDRLVARLLEQPPAARLAARAPAGFAPARVLGVLVEHEVDVVVIGATAAALHGSPLALGRRELEVVPAPAQATQLAEALEALEAAPGPVEDTFGPLHARRPYALPGDQALVVVEEPAGTRGYDDLRADAVVTAVDELGETCVAIASVVDLLRIADRSPWEHDQVNRPALRTVSQQAHQRRIGWRPSRAAARDRDAA